MARTTIDHKIFTDSRFFELCFRLGSKTMAIGAMAEAWILAQQFVTPETEDGPVPEHTWRVQKINSEILEVGLASLREGFIHVAGAKENFAWLVRNQRASRKGGAATRAQHKDARDKAHTTNGVTGEGPTAPHGHPAGSRTGAVREPALASSPSPSPSPSLSQIKKISKGAEVLPAAIATGSNLSTLKELKKSETNKSVARLIGVYVKAWQTARKSRERPPVTKAFGIFPKLLLEYPEQKIGHCLEAYCQIDDRWFKENGWDLATFQAKFPRILLALDKGDPRGIDWDFVFEREQQGVIQ